MTVTLNKYLPTEFALDFVILSALHCTNWLFVVGRPISVGICDMFVKGFLKALGIQWKSNGLTTHAD